MDPTDKLIIMVYPKGLGGKLIANSLAMSDNGILQQYYLALLQMDGKINASDIFKLLQKRIVIHDPVSWVDLDLGCYELYGRETPLKGTTMPDITKRLIDSNNFFFVMVHTTKELQNILQEWPNAQVVLMKNNVGFFAGGRYLPKSEQYDDYIINREQTHIWDHSMIDNQFSDHVQELAIKIGITGLNIHLVSKFHKLWLKHALGLVVYGS